MKYGKDTVVLAKSGIDYNETMRQVTGYLRGLIGNKNVSVRFVGNYTDMVSKVLVQPVSVATIQPDNVTKRLTHIVNDIETKTELKVTITPDGNKTTITLTRQVRRV